MRIGINLLPIRKKLTGVGVYAYNIIAELVKKDKNNKYLLFVNRENRDVFSFDKDNIQTIEFPISAENVFQRIFWEQFLFPFYLKKHQVDLLFSPSVVMPVFSSCKNVVCIHDLTPFHIKRKFNSLRTNYVKIMTKVSARRADKILTVSYNSKIELQKFCNIPLEKISITYNSINGKILSPDLQLWEKFKKEKCIPERYILYVGTLEPGKNIINLVRAFKQVKYSDQLDHKLVIAGGKGWLFNDIFKEIRKLKIVNDVIFPDYVPESILGLLYQNAAVSVLPSLYEGFGIPALEAMYFGTPVIVSKVSSLPEVVGDAGKLVNPNDTDEIAEAIKEVILNKSLSDKMIKRGIEQSKKFSWRRSAEIALKVFLEV